MIEPEAEHLSRIVRILKDVLDDERMTAEQKIRLLGMIL